MKNLITSTIRKGLVALEADHPEFDAETVDIQVTPPNKKDHGDYASNVALIVAGELEIRDRRGLAEVVAQSLEFPEGTIAKVEVAGPGFLNFHIDDRWYQNLVARIVAQDEEYGRLARGAGQSVLVEFVSANPTGPLTVGHGRNAILGDVIARLYESSGYQVTREYYFNNAGRQMRVLAESLRARYRELLGLPFEFPEDGYQGEYLRDIAEALRDGGQEPWVAAAAETAPDDEGERALRDEVVAAFRDGIGDGWAERGLPVFRTAGEMAMFTGILGTCRRLGIEFDRFYNENELYRAAAGPSPIDRVVAELRAQDLAYDQDGAVWFRGTARGLEKDPVIIKSSGEPTYRLPDMAYHRDKLARGFDRIVDVFGADHIDTCQEVLAALAALGEDVSRVTVVIYQFVTLQRGGEQVKMSTRKADFETLEDLTSEVGAEAVRYFFAMRSPRSHMEFDLDLAKSQANDNPMYYAQYAHARICSILGKPEAAALGAEALDLTALEHPAERDLVTQLALLPEVLQRALAEHEPHRMTGYAAEVATAFHAFYDRCPILAAATERQGRARLELARATKIVMRNVLQMIGVSAPESM